MASLAIACMVHPMHILFVTSEMLPISGSGPRARLSASLAKVMARAEHHVTVLSPLYKGIDLNQLGLARRLTKLAFNLGGRDWACEFYTGRLPTGVHLMFIGNEELLSSVESIDEGNETAVAMRSAVFAAAASELLRVNEAEIDIVHGIDWFGAGVVARLAQDKIELPRILTVHDVDEIGVLATSDDLGFGPDAYHDGKLQLMAAGMQSVDRITTLSANFANRIASDQNSHPLQEAFAKLRHKVVGIRDGIDPAVWNPLTDPHLAARFDPVDRSGKAKCKAELQHALTLDVKGDVPLIGAVGRVEGDGLDLLAKVAPDILKNDVRLVVQLEGDGELVGIYEELWDQWPDKIQIRTGCDEAFRHQLLAGADFVLVPGREAPTEGLQLCAMRYGALPIVHREGGLADEVVDCDAALKSGSGFLFDERTEESLLACVRRVIGAYANTPGFTNVQSRVMRFDHSWERTSRLYDRLYRELIQDENQTK